MAGLDSLGFDLIECLFAFIPDFRTLKSTILINRNFLSIFNNRKERIVYQVSLNVAGLALDDALRLIRYNFSDWWNSHEGARLCEYWGEVLNNYVEYQPPVWSATKNPVEPDEAANLEVAATEAEQLEDMFSFRHKSRRSLKSMLTPNESFKFSRAVYRLALFRKLFEYWMLPYETVRDAWGGRDELDLSGWELEFNDARYKFLESYTVEELREMQVVARFASEMRDQLVVFNLNYDHNATKDLLHTVAFDMPVYAEEDDDEIPYELIEKYLSGPMREALKEDFLEDDDPDFYLCLLDDIDGQFDKCCSCGEIRGCALWNCTNWNLFFLHSGLSFDSLIEVFRTGLFSRGKDDYSRTL
ncbi:hypothetical protein DL96DRAFT_1211 [Flagelloscypha sp. PMI_526]|nr:hypothetical protein DL96DRAFT_1211 [Flagelloscypha sp. PMI_526]